MPQQDKNLAEAQARGLAMRQAPGRLQRVVVGESQVDLHFQSGVCLVVPMPLWEAQLRQPGQRTAPPEALPLGDGVAWPDTHVGLHIPTLLMEWLDSPGLREVVRVAFARQASSVVTEKRREAARLNGAKGGRPRKLMAQGQ